MRVIAGVKKGIRLASFQHYSIRPTTDRVKESLFNVLGDVIRESEVLDIFAGTGSLGIEALSRGAARAIFVEKHPTAQKTILQNLQKTGFSDKSELFKLPAQRALKLLAKQDRTFDIIFADPPYGDDLLNETVQGVLQQNLLRPGGWFVMEHSSRSQIREPVEPLVFRLKKSQGETEVSFYQNG